MYSDSIVLSAANKIAVAFDMDDLDVSTSLVASTSIDVAAKLHTIREALANRIVELLNSNPEKLMMLLYRIDVSEPRVNEIFNNSIPPDVPEALADLIIERQLAKAETRARGGV